MQKLFGIYKIVNTVNDRVYVGKSINVKRRLSVHKSQLKSKNRSKDYNRYLWNSVKKYGLENFTFELVEEVFPKTKDNLADRELFWMDEYKSCDRNFGYNLRRDSSSQTWVHEDTRKLISENYMGEGNPNYGNNWTDEQKEHMSKTMKDLYKQGVLVPNLEALDKGRKNKEINFKENPQLKLDMAKKVSDNKSLYDYLKIDIITGEILEEFSTFMNLKETYPKVGKTVVNSVCNGYKVSYLGYLWRYRSKETGEIIVNKLKNHNGYKFYYSLEGENYLSAVTFAKNKGVCSSTIYRWINSDEGMYKEYYKKPITHPYIRS